MHDYRSARERYLKGLEILNKDEGAKDGLYRQILFNLSKVYEKLRNYEQANAYIDHFLEESISLKEQYGANKLKAINLTKMKKYGEAAKLIEEQIILHEPDDEDIYIALADNQFNAQAYEKALEAYQQYVDLYKSGNRLLDARFGLVQSYYQLEQYENALEEAKKTDAEFSSKLYEEIQEKIKFNQEQEKKDNG